jgi:ferric-dicitrate binding protein FerR (iron transport regulator)
MDPVNRTRVLGQRFLDGLATAGELAELEQLLRTDPAAADYFARLSRLEADLSAQFSEEPRRLREAAVLHAIERDQRRRHWWGRGLRLAVAASFLLLISGVIAWWLGQPAPVVRDVAGNVVLEGEVLVDGQAVEHLEDGSALLVAGPAPALLRLSDGSRARLEPASEAVVHGAAEGIAQRFELIEGAGKFEVRRAREPFLVDTPAGSVSAEDSEFTVKLTKSDPGDTQIKMRRSLLAVMVLSGLAQVETDSSYRLMAGEQRVFALQRDAANGRPIWYFVEPGREGAVFGQERAVARVAANGNIFGIVSEVKDGKLTIAFGRRLNPTQESFDVGPTLKVLVDGKPGKLTDLVKGAMVRVERNDKGELLSVTTEGPMVSGTVKAVADGKITLDGRGPAFVIEQDTEYAVSADAKITIDRQPAKLADLKPGHRVLLKLSMNRKSALMITSMSIRQVRPPAAIGEFKAIDARTGTITISVVRGNQERTMNLDKDVRVVIDGQPAKLDDLKTGKTVVLRLDRDGKTVQAINVMGVRRPPVGFSSGVISEVKGSKLTVSIRGRDAATEKTYEVGEMVRVFIEGKPAKLAELVKGMTVLLGLDDKEHLAVIRADGPSITGKVKVITAEKITIDTRRNASSYAVSPDVIVIIDRRPGKIADVKADMEVVLKLSVDGKTAVMIRKDVSREPWNPFVRGEIKAIDAKANTITLAVTTGRPGARKVEERTFTLGKQVSVGIDGRPVGMADLKAGTEVTLTVDREGKTVLRIAVASGVRGEPRREPNNSRE